MDPVLLCSGICGRKREMRSCKYMTEKEREGGRMRGAARGVSVQVHDNNVITTHAQCVLYAVIATWRRQRCVCAST